MTSVHATGAPVADAPDAFARKALIASAVGYAMDGFDLFILGFMLRAISAELHLTPPQAGSLVTRTLVGAVAGVIAFAVRWYVGEPKIFVERAKTAHTMAPLRMLVKDAATTKISLGMFILCSVQNFGYYGVMIWLPSYLSTRFGFGLTQSALWT